MVPSVRTRHPVRRLLLAALSVLALLIIVVAPAPARAVKISSDGKSSSAARDTDQTMQNLSTHILDTTRGKPAPEVPVTLYRRNTSQTWTKIGAGITDTDGRFREFFPTAAGSTHGLQTGVYKLHFEVGAYFRNRTVESLYPFIEIVFNVVDATQHYHIPLLLNPFGYSTYRGS